MYFPAVLKIRTFLLAQVISFSAFSQIVVQTNLPPVIAPNSTLNIEVKINKGSISNFAKYQMDFPAGVTIAEGNSLGGNFTFETGRVKIVWVSLPAENEFIFSFLLMSGNASGSATLNHKFYFVDNGTKKDIEPDPITVKFDASGVSSANPLSPSSNTTTAIAANVNTNTKVAEPVVNTKTPDPPKENLTTETKTEPNGVQYRLQLSASAADPGKAKFSSLGKVEIVHEAGFYKVLYGSYNSKEEALKKREELLQKGQSSFVVAYLNGVRQK
jgi:hypothetical protein